MLSCVSCTPRLYHMSFIFRNIAACTLLFYCLIGTCRMQPQRTLSSELEEL